MTTAGRDQVTEWFDTHRGQLRGLAYRMLGSLSDVDDALQETWLRASRADPSSVENPGAWLRTILARVCLNMLRARGSRREEPLEPYLPEPVVSPFSDGDPEGQALLAESVGLALLVVLRTLTPAERLAFVLHDVFDVSFTEIAPILERTPAAARQLASRARRRVQRAPSVPDVDLSSQRRIVDAFFAAARSGDMDGLVTILDRDVVLRADFGTGRPLVARGVADVTRYARAPRGAEAIPALVNGGAGAVIVRSRRIFAVLAFSVQRGRIIEIYGYGGPERLRHFDLATLIGAIDELPDGGDREPDSSLALG